MKDNVIPLHRPPPSGSSYDAPILVRDPETGLYDVVFQGCVTHAGLDVVGEREAIKRASTENGGVDGG